MNKKHKKTQNQETIRRSGIIFAGLVFLFLTAIVAMYFNIMYLGKHNRMAALGGRPILLALIVTVVIVIFMLVALLVFLRRLSASYRDTQTLTEELLSLANIYRSAHDLDIINDTFTEIVTNNPNVSDMVGNKREDAQVVIRTVMGQLTDESCREDMMKFIDFSTLNQRLEDRLSIAIEFLNIENLWLRGRFIVSQRTPKGKLSHVLWMVENIDEEHRERYELSTIAQNLNYQIASVMMVYMSAYEFDIDNDTFVEVKSDSQTVKDLVGNEQINAQATLFHVMENIAHPTCRDEVLRFCDFSDIRERLKGQVSITLEFLNYEEIWRRGRMLVSRRDETGRITHVLWLVEDINEEKRRRDRLIETSQRAIAASEAKSAFLSNMSHEIRTPINAVLGMNEMILRESEDENVLTYSENIRAAGSSLLGIINDILDFSKIEAGKMEIIPADYDLASTVCDLVTMIQTKAEEKGLILTLDFDKTLPKHLHGDEVRIKQVITNILTNAVKYTEKGSVIFSIGYEKVADEDAVMLLVSVKDTGIGIKQEDVEKLFTEFERIEEKRNRNIEGTGLGMNITQSLLHMMGSNLEVESVYGLGSKFSFKLKQTVRDWEELGNYESLQASAAERRETYRERFNAPDVKVLVVDDTPMNLMVFRGLLKKTKVKIDAAASGDEGLELMRKKTYDMIFLDHMMPGKDGIEVLHELKAEKDNPNLHTPVICLTANAISGAREKYLAEGFEDYLTKPVDFVRLEELMLQYLPKDKVHEESEVDAASMGSIPKFVFELKEIDTAVGLKNCGDEDLYLEMLRTYVETSVDATTEIEDYMKQGDLKDATIKIHALKSTSRLIGAVDLGELAYSLEKAGKEDDLATVKRHLPELMERCRALGKALAELGPGDGEDDFNLEIIE